MSKCLYCYMELEDGQKDFHPSCSRKIFGTAEVPELPYERAQMAELAGKIVRSQIAVTGAQAKLSLDLQKGLTPRRFTIVGLWGKYILKPSSTDYTQLPENEDLTMHLAEIAGIKTVPHSLIRLADGELCYITKRIDRDENGNKLAMEDMCQLTERLTEYKYKGSYEQIAKIILEHSVAPKLDLANFWEVVLFSWITGNSDMHLKNFSLYSPYANQYMLTPAYDLVSTVLVIPKDPEELALNLNGKKRKIKREDFKIAMLQSGLDEKVFENICAKFEKVQSKWLSFINQSFLGNSFKCRYRDIIVRNMKKFNK